MSSPTIIEKAEAVKDFLLSSYPDATVEIAPEYSLPKLSVRKIAVVPMSMEHSIQTRGVKEKVYHVDIGFLQRATINDVPSLIETLEQMGDSMLGKTIGSAVCTEVVWEPIYSAEDIRSKNQFSGIISATLKEYD